MAILVDQRTSNSRSKYVSIGLLLPALFAAGIYTFGFRLPGQSLDQIDPPAQVHLSAQLPLPPRTMGECEKIRLSIFSVSDDAQRANINKAAVQCYDEVNSYTVQYIEQNRTLRYIQLDKMPKSPTSIQRAAMAAMNEATSTVRDRLRDPNSANFKAIEYNPETKAVCGQFNSKNGFGGYVGFQSFVVVMEPKPNAFLQQDGAVVFDAMKTNFCG